MARETVQVVLVKCDGCGRAIDPAADVNFGCCDSNDPAWKRDNMANYSCLTLVCYVVHQDDRPDPHEGGYRPADCCEHCMRELLKKVNNIV